MTKSSNSKAMIIAAATDLMNIKGFRATSVNDIIDAVGVTKGCFFHHFTDKQSLGVAVLESSREKFMEFLNAILAGGTGKAALNSFLDGALEMHRSREFIGGCIFGNIALEIADSESSLLIPLKNLFSDWVDNLELTISQGQRDGELTLRIPARELALLVVSILEGGIMLSRLNKSETALKTNIKSIKRLLTPRVDMVSNQNNTY